MKNIVSQLIIIEHIMFFGLNYDLSITGMFSEISKKTIKVDKLYSEIPVQHIKSIH